MHSATASGEAKIHGGEERQDKSHSASTLTAGASAAPSFFVFHGEEKENALMHLSDDALRWHAGQAARVGILASFGVGGGRFLFHYDNRKAPLPSVMAKRSFFSISALLSYCGSFR